MPKPTAVEIAMRLVVRNPIPGVLLRVQRGSDELVEPVASSRSEAIFHFSLRATQEGGGAVNFLGPFSQGPKGGRFLYLNAGRRAGQSGTLWDRRAKIPLGSVSWVQVEQVSQRAGARLSVTIDGRGKDGGPVCASVPLGPSAWQVHLEKPA